MAPRLGILYPGHSAEDEYLTLGDRLVARPEVDLVHTVMGEDAHRVDALLEIGSEVRLAEGAGRLGPGCQSVMWACTSGSFVFGWDGARRQVDLLADHLQVPVSSTSFAFVEALEAMSVGSVAIAATYPRDVADAFADFLANVGVEVLATDAQGIVTAAEVGTLTGDRILEFVSSGDHPDADAVLVPDTALHTLDHLEALETALSKPVLTANQVTVWQALRLAGALGPEPALGPLAASS